MYIFTHSYRTHSHTGTHLHTHYVSLRHTSINTFTGPFHAHAHSLHTHSRTCTYLHTDIHIPSLPSRAYACTHSPHIHIHTLVHTHTHTHTLCTPSPTHTLMQPTHTLPSSTHTHSRSHTCAHSYTASHTRVPFLISLLLRNCSFCTASPLQPPQRAATIWGLGVLGRGAAPLSGGPHLGWLPTSSRH